MSDANLQDQTARSYLSGGNAGYLEDLYERFLKDPTSVDQEWQHYFQGLPKVNGLAGFDISHADIREQLAQLAKQPARFSASSDVIHERQQAAVHELIAAYKTYGHLAARINPLHEAPPYPEELRLEHYPDLMNADQTQLFDAGALLPTSHASLQEIIAALNATYCNTIGAEFMGIRSPQERAWIAQRLEKRLNTTFLADKKRAILWQLITADGLEKFLAAKYVGQKRFSLEGGDAYIPLLHAINEQATTHGVNEIVIGMAHRGRLSTLINVMGKPPTELFEEFEGRKNFGLTSGDVKYHLGYSSDIETKAGILHLSLAFNPSHLEIITPVVMGSVRARQERRTDGRKEKQVLALQVHGDASFAGQGVVMESLNMSQTHAYKIGGSIHVVINNQVGFTTSDPHDARSSHYCTDIAKMIEAPVFHVNGDDPEAVAFVGQLATDYRAEFHKDVVIDLVCYRRLGHNEADEPAATQPLMYHHIRQHPLPRELYATRLINEGVCTQAEVDAMLARYRDTLDAGKPVVNTLPDRVKQEHASYWKPHLHQDWSVQTDTSIPLEKLTALAKKLETLPPGFEVQRQVGHTLATRAQMTAGELPVDWGYAEVLAYATLLDAGHPVRMSGQDCRRGTFAHRHATLHDQNTGKSYTPLAHISETTPYQAYDSLLSEMGAMGFEYGYASTDPTALVLWEAQYGDFANGAQIVIDQFISSAWQKWQTLSGLTLLLPHGYEGAGPEHTSARLERYLQLCAEENMQVCMPTTPAQIFHLLRRQVMQALRIPLIVMTPKSMLRNKLAVSPFAELSQGQFQMVIPEIDPINAADVTQIILCSGKVYYDLLTKRREQKANHIAILRVEQLYPFPHDTLQKLLKSYKNAKNIVWCQEEPENQGAWHTTRHRLEACLSEKQALHFIGRHAAASPAAGYMKLHVKQQEDLVARALGLTKK